MMLWFLMACRTKANVIAEENVDSPTDNTTFESSPEDDSNSPTDSVVNEDSDNDGLTDEQEEEIGTNPNDEDSDDDGINDRDEIIIGTDPNNPDTDGDGLTDEEEVNLGTDPNNTDTDGDGTSDGDEVSEGSNPNGTDPESDTGNFWDWGDNANNNCSDCDPSIFAGIYDVDVLFQSSIGSTILCNYPTSFFLSSVGEMNFATSCTTSTGASFDFDFDLYVAFNNQYASAEYGVLAGDVSVTIPDGTMYSQTIAPQEFFGAVTTLCCGNFGPYYDINFLWRPLIQTPSGAIEYIIYFQGFKQ